MASRLASEVLALIGRDLLRARLVRPVNVITPGPGADWAVAVPGGVIWEVLSIRATFTTSAVVANRGPRLQITDGNQQVYVVAPNVQQSAGVSFTWSWGQGLGALISVANTNNNSLPTPPLPLSSGSVILTSTQVIDVGDQWGAIVLMVREWDETAIIQEAQELFAGLDEYIESGYREGSDY